MEEKKYSIEAYVKGKCEKKESNEEKVDLSELIELTDEQNKFLDMIENLSEEDIRKEEEEQAKHKVYTIKDVAQAIIDSNEDKE